MILRRWLALGCLALGTSLAASPASAQLILPSAGGAGSFGGANTGGYSASVPLDMPAARGGLPVPVQITYSEHGVGAAGRGWDVPLSYLQSDTTIVRRRPIGTANVAPQGRQHMSLVLNGQSSDLVQTASGWIARDAPQIDVHDNGDGTWSAYDGHGLTYLFTAPAGLAGTGVWLLQDITGVGGSKVHLDYNVATPTISGNAAIAIDLTTVSYNPHPTMANCYKNAVSLTYDGVVSPPLGVSILGTKLLARQHKLKFVDILSKADCSPTNVRLREYTFTYQADGDMPDPNVQQWRLQKVTMTGRSDRTDGATSLPVATYSYGTVTNGGALVYQQLTLDPNSATNEPNAGDTQIGGPVVPVIEGSGTGLYADKLLVDINGDGRADAVTLSRLIFANLSQSTSDTAKFGGITSISNNTLLPRSLDARTSQTPGFQSMTVAYNRVWRQLIDVNGDGRVDLVDAAEEPDHWIVYLNTPDPSDPTAVQWTRLTYSIVSLRQLLINRGLASASDTYLPLTRRAVGNEGRIASCWMWVLNNPSGKPTGPGHWTTAPPDPSCLPAEPPFQNGMITEWELKDVNGDGYPDVVFDSSAASMQLITVSDPRGRRGSPGELITVEQAHALTLPSTNRIDAVFNVLGTRITSGVNEPFSSPVTLINQDTCGVEQWSPDASGALTIQCGTTDVNGDGIMDRVKGTSVQLGTGALDGGDFFTSASMLTLPGPLARDVNGQAQCSASVTTYPSSQTAGLLDVTGDGIPDYVTISGSTWNVSIGTGTGFSAAIQTNTQSTYLTKTLEQCDGTSSSVLSGLFDVDGDGRPDFVNNGAVSVLSDAAGNHGIPSGGRLITIDNGFGATTNIHYRSIKGDSGVVHQVPFAEIVVDSVDVSASLGLGGSLSATRYAYGGAQMVWDPARDRFVFPGYQRTITMPTPIGQDPGVATFMITDAYAPASGLDPYGVAAGATVDADTRYLMFRRIGRTSDVTILSGTFDVSAITNPTQLLGVNVQSDVQRIAAAHYEFAAVRQSSTSDPAGPEACTEAIFPYDYSGSATFTSSHPTFDPCVAHGFVYGQSVRSWRGAPGAAPPAPANVESLSEVTSVDAFGQITSVKNSNDVHRTDDDLCINTAYAQATGTPTHVRTAASSRTVSDCGTTIYAEDTWEYDQLPAGQVAAGLVTSHSVERHDDTGALLGTIRQFDTTYDPSGNPSSVSATRDGSVTRTITPSYDAFELAITGMTTAATGLASMQVSTNRDPITLLVTSTTDPNSTTRTAYFDAFEREYMTTITPPGGSEVALSYVTFQGFTGGGSGRTITETDFPDAVTISAAPSAPGRSSTRSLDEIGRVYMSTFALGSANPNVTLNSRRTYDGQGRVVFEADPYPSTQTFPTVYGTTRFFNADGTPSCSIRATGQQTTAPSPAHPPTTDETNHIFPTCVERVFQDNTEIVRLHDAASYLQNSPQQDLETESAVTAIGQLIARSTWKDSARIEHATFAHDPLGHLTGMTRYQDASGAAKPVTSSWHYDSLGQLLELDEPDSVPQFNTYSNWGELTDTSRNPSGGGAPDATHGLHVVAHYDALGRVVHREEQNNGVTDAATVDDYFYDQGVNITPHVTPTYLQGRLAQANSPTGSVSFGYDAAGRVNTRVFNDNAGMTYVESDAFHDDGLPKTVNLLLPDTTQGWERITYGYDSAGRGNQVTYQPNVADPNNTTDTTGLTTLYQASQIDPWGRVRNAQYGAASYTADYDEVTRRLLNQVTVSSMAGSRSIAFSSYDPVGRERSRTETKNDPTLGTTSASLSHTYDALGRLSSSVKTAGSTTLFNQQFTYDPLGNLLSIADTSGSPNATNTTLSYLGDGHDRDRICRAAYGADNGTDCNVTYDEVGAITSMPTPNGTRQYTYYADGSVRSIQDDHASAQFRYDALGAVQELDVSLGAPPLVPDARTDRRYGDMLAWHNEMINGTPTAILQREIPGPDGFLATLHGPGGSWVFTYGEARGNRFFTDQNGNFVQDVGYEPFGKATSTGAQPGSSLYSNEQWNGGDALAAFGLSQLGARIYDPAIGRFVSRDPLLIPQTAATTNPYAFANNDPVNGSDPSGLMDKPQTDDPPPCDDCPPEGGGWEPNGVDTSGLVSEDGGLPPWRPGYNGPEGNQHTHVQHLGGGPLPLTTIIETPPLPLPAAPIAAAGDGVVATTIAAEGSAPMALGGAAQTTAEGAGELATGLGGAVLAGAAVGLGVFVWPATLSDDTCAPPNACGKNRGPRVTVNLDSGAIINATQLDDLWKAFVINAYLANKHRVVTVTALDEFFNGGPGKSRGAWEHAGFFERMAVVAFLADTEIVRDDPSARVVNLIADSKSSAKALGSNDRVIFGTGDKYHWQTITTDSPFFWAAANRRVILDVKIFDPAAYSGR